MRKSLTAMTIQNEAAYQAGMSRLEALDSNNPANLAEMEALGNALEAYEDSQGHAPVRPDSLVFRTKAGLSPLRTNS
ncbi:hypothetical protein BEN49_17215 [Hymenobacter coccineus]|uniref:Uncharacterized protein n=2 Tax=Hymenobacter coccineus TaxID=1908235 RepID=A0A1G1TMI9_9BACT|nr:hypothetical protein BEN49_17215 [Hymenobacter coccineus]